MHSFLRLSPSSSRLGAIILTLAVLLLGGCSSSEDRAKSYYEHGKQLLAAKDYTRAEIEFRNAIKYDQKLLPAWQSLGQLEEQRKNYGALIPVFRTILELDSGDQATRLKLARLLLLSNKPDDALRLINDSKEADNQNAEVLALKAGILFKLNDRDGAVREAEAALKIDPKDTGAMLVLAADASARGDTAGALKILNNETMAQTNDIGVALFKLQILEKIQDLPQAEDLLQKLSELNPKENAFKKELVRLYLSQHRNDDAEKEQRSLVAADPKNLTANMDLVQLLFATKGPDAARQELTTLINAGGDTFNYQIALAQFDFSQKRFAEATALLKKLISDASSPEHVLTAQINLAEMYLAQKQVDAAQAVVADILKQDARNVTGLKLRAAIRLSRNELEGAISDLRQALNDQPRSTDLMLLLATAYERSGSIDLAEKEFAEAMRVSNFNPAISLNYVAFLQRRGSMTHAEDVLTDLASRSPNNVEVLSALAQVKLVRQEWVAAQEIAEAIKRIGTNRTVADELLGAAFAGQKKYDQSIVAFQDAYASAPRALQPMAALVRTYLRAEKPDQAIAFLRSVLKADPSSAEAYVLLGSVQMVNKSPDQARQSFAAAIEKQPHNPIGYDALSDYYLAQKNYPEALKVTRAGLKEQPNNSALRLSLADLLQRTADYEGAISEYEKLLAEDPASIVVANNLASLLADHRTDKESLDRAQALAANLRKIQSPQFQDTLGWVSYRQGDYKAALPLLEQAAKELPNVSLVHYHLGMTYVANGEPQKASEQFKLALDQSPDNDLEGKIKAAQKKLGG